LWRPAPADIRKITVDSRIDEVISETNQFAGKLSR